MTTLAGMARLLAGEGLRQCDDAELLRCFEERRDERAFAEVVARHEATVLGVCRRALGGSHLAEDVFQAAVARDGQRAPPRWPRPNQHEPGGRVTALAFDRDGSRLVTGNQGGNVLVRNARE
jgi:hypothetical protein